MEAWEAICGSHETQELAMAAIQVQLTEEDLQKLRDGERSDGAGTTAAKQRQQGQDDRSNLAGD